ncbi:uncharacterized protein YukE [Prauserella sediminis]|uniref:Uncharacterized protein YukE n=1 Tax=Prauserella sediminis TaxID=577680 RepID=A0A839XJ52_9PSEU|nr:hypothetical protein [Prauserella sediminis]MBB3663310.1 uncharacterized protein YukE [Prauserella sediminis]
MNIDNDSGLIGSDLAGDGAAGDAPLEAGPAPIESGLEAGPAPVEAGLQGGPAPLAGVGGGVRLGEAGEVSDIVGRARNRQDGFAYDSERAIADRPNWEAHESKQLYAFATVNNVPGSAEEIGSSWGRHGTTLQQVSEDLYATISELGTAWIGQAAGAAQGALVGIANSSSQAAEAARAMSQRLSQQASAAAELKKMPQPEEFDPASETANMLAMGPAAMAKDMKEKFDQARAVKAQQVQYLNTYTAAMSEVDNSTPSFGPESLGLKQSTNSGGTHVSSVGGPGAVGSVGSVATGGPTGGVRGAEGLAAHGGPAHQAASQAPQQPAPQAPQQPAAQAPAPGVSAAGQAAPSSPSAGGLGAVAGGAALAGGGAALAGRALAKGSKTSASDKEQHDEGATSAQSQQAAQPAASVQQPQNSGMPGAGGVIGGREAAAMAPAATPMGGGGMGAGGMGAAGAAAGNAQGEEEHTHASFLIEADPDDVFGANQATAPPVLGAWGPDDEE